MTYGVYKLVMEGLVKEFGPVKRKPNKHAGFIKKSGPKSGPRLVFLHPSHAKSRAILFGTFGILNIKEREVYQKVWPSIWRRRGAKKTPFGPDFGPDFFIRPSFTNSCATLGINQTPPNEHSLTGALCLCFASIDGCPFLARTPSPPLPAGPRCPDLSEQSR